MVLEEIWKKKKDCWKAEIEIFEVEKAACLNKYLRRTWVIV